MIDFRYTNPRFDILKAAHAEYVVTDLHRAHDFYVDALGFVLTLETPTALFLRGYEERHHHSLVLRKGNSPHLGHIAFRVASEDDLDLLFDHYDRQGLAPRWVKEEEPGQGLALRVQDPAGFPAEFFCEMAAVECLVRRYDLYRGAEVMRLDHFNLLVSNCAAGFDYYKSLGFRCSEYTTTDDGDEQLWAAWMFRKPDVHDVALMNGRGPRLHHTGWWVTDPMSAVRACDRLAALGRAEAIERGPGRHGLSNAFFLYLRDPDGHRIELYTSDYYTGDPDLQPLRWSVNDPMRQTFWGHAAPASWFEESSVVANYSGGMMEVTTPRLHHRPQTVT